MNALLQRNVFRTVQRRFASSMTTNKQGPSFVPPMYKTSFKEAYLSDPSTYPLFAIMTFVTFLIAGMTVNAFTNLKDLRIRSAVKHETIQTWGYEKSESAAHRFLANLPTFTRSSEWKAIRAGEGLGVDHDKWVKEHSQK